MNITPVIDKIESFLKSRSLDGYEIFLSASRNLTIEVKERKVDTFKCSAPVGVSIRVLKSRAMGFSYSTSMDESDLLKMIYNAMTSAEFQTPDEFNIFPLPEA